jgi:hypothetical protein
MKNLLCCLLIVPSIFMGCAQTHFFSKESKWTIFNRVNDKHDKVGKIQTTRQISFEGKNILIATDSTVWIDSKTKKRHAIATSLIKEITFSSNEIQYFMAGAGIGLMGGVFSGLVLGFVEDSKTALKNTLNPFSNEELSGIKKGVIIGGTVGMGVGSLIGLGLAPREKFVLDYQGR